MVENFAALFNRTPDDRVSDSIMARPKAVGTGALSSVDCSCGAGLMIFCFRFPVVLFGSPGSFNCHATMFL